MKGKKMYTNWLATCTEKQLFVFIEASMTTLVEEQERAPLWAMGQEELIMQAMERTTRFGVPRTEPDFNTWYAKNLTGWYNALQDDELIAALREMPWNERTN